MQLTVAESLENADALDSVSTPLTETVRKVLPPGRLRNLLHGVPIGHPVHPVLVQVPIGAWLSAGVLDLTPRTGPAAPVLIGVGIGASLPAAFAGSADWSELHPAQQRVGLVHATLNTVALGLYSASLIARLRGRRSRGLLYAYAGLTMVGASGYLGGHLAYRQAAGPNHAEEVPHVVSAGWHDLGELTELPENELIRRSVNDLPVMVLRRGGGVTVLAERCSHLDGPLADGELTRDDSGQECVVCPWHGSTFRLTDGSVFRGPATAPQPVFEVQIDGGRVKVRLPGAE